MLFRSPSDAERRRAATSAITKRGAIRLAAAPTRRRNRSVTGNARGVPHPTIRRKVAAAVFGSGDRRTWSVRAIVKPAASRSRTIATSRRSGAWTSRNNSSAATMARSIAAWSRSRCGSEQVANGCGATSIAMRQASARTRRFVLAITPARAVGFVHRRRRVVRPARRYE